MARDPNVIRPIGFKPSEISAMINRTVIDQHADDAAFLWTQRDRAVLAPQYSLKDLAELDERVEANVDGLRVAGNAGWETIVQAIDMGSGEIFAAGLLAFEGSDRGRRARVIEAGVGEPPLARGLISALGWMPAELAASVADELLQSSNAEIRRIGIGGLAVHRLDPGPHLIAAISAPDSRLRARALKAVAELGRTDLLGAVILQLSDSDDDCRFAGAWSAARLGESSEKVLSILRDFAETGGPHAIASMDIALRRTRPAAANAWRRSLMEKPATSRLGAIGAGVIGDPALIDELLASLSDPALARVAGEAFATITGVDLGYDDLDADAPEDLETTPSDDAEDEDVAPDPDEDLQWPSSERIAQWWSKNRDRFRLGVRYLAGRPISPESLSGTLVNGMQRQRAAAALEIALRRPSEPIFEVRECGNRQLEKVKQWIS